MRYPLAVFLLLSTILSNVYLSNSIENHILQQRETIKSLTKNNEKLRYKIYGETKETKGDLTGFTVFQFSSTFFVVFCLLVCERRRKKEIKALESEKADV